MKRLGSWGNGPPPVFITRRPTVGGGMSQVNAPGSAAVPRAMVGPK